VSRAFLICPEPVRELTAGVGTRFTVLAGVLADAGHQVTLAIPNDPAEATAVRDGIELLHARPERLGEQAQGHDWVLLHGHLGNHYLSQRDDQPVVVDLYDPFMIENLHYHRELGFAPYNTDHATWRLQMMRGDLFLCSSEEQRLYYLGWLSALGRVNPLSLEDDPGLEHLIVELPFGTPAEPPPTPPARRELMGDDTEGSTVLYFGGIYDWYDPLVVLEALPDLLESHPSVVVLFVDHPHPELTPQSLSHQARAIAEKRNWLGRQVRFEPWRPYDRRYELAQVSDLAVVCHRPGIESDLSLRTRLVDLMWLGLPLVVTAGGAMARVVRETGAGLVVPPQNPAALVEALRSLLEDAGIRERASAAGRGWAASRNWTEVARPLLDFAESPRRDPVRERFARLAPEPVSVREPIIRRILRRLGGFW
jgi:glycosyltransferase involved in cell wall biosynthesis